MCLGRERALLLNDDDDAVADFGGALHLDDGDAFDDGGAGVVDAVEEGLELDHGGRAGKGWGLLAE